MMARKNKNLLTITVPEPCAEDWGKMRVVDSEHRHCDRCERTLTDFTTMSDDELVLFFRHNNKKLCGRFKKHQLDRPLAAVPEVQSKARWWKAAVLLPLTLLSKSSSAQQNDSIPVVDSLEVVSNDTFPELQVDPIDSSLVSNDPLRHADTVVIVSTPESKTVEVDAGTVGYMVMNRRGCPYPPEEIHTVVMGNVGPQFPPRFTPNWFDEYAFGWFTFRKKTDEEQLASPNSSAITNTDPKKKADDPVAPPVPDAPWYEAILPSAIRIKRNG